MASTNPHSLSIDELPSPFPLPLTSVQSYSSAQNGSGGGNGPNGGGPGRRKAKGGGMSQVHAFGGLGKAILLLTGGKEVEIESDLGEIRKLTKRRRAAATGGLAKLN